MANSSVISIDCGRVRPFADQPREYFDAGELVSLELSIKQRGQLQPGMVRQLRGDRDHDFELVDGQRRWHACQRLAVPFRAVIIEPRDEEDQYEISVAANFQRAQHTPMEIAKAIERICTHGRRAEEYVATLFGKSGAWVSMYRRLNDLVPEIQGQLEPNGPREKWLAINIAVNLARLPKEQQLPTLQEIQARGLTAARAVEKIRRMLIHDEPVRRPDSKEHSRNIANFVRVTIQRVDLTMDRMGPDDMRMLVANLVKRRQYDELRESLMTAIGRLEVLHRRLTECKATMQTAPVTPQKPAPTSTKPADTEAFVYSQQMRCPKCGNAARFKRRSDADLQKDFWVCDRKGCQLKISHYNIKIDRHYGRGLTAGA